MKFKIQLVYEAGEDAGSATEDIFAFNKASDCFEDIGMTLSQSKQILKNLQRCVVEKQLADFIRSKSLQGLRKKGSYPVKLKTLFGDIIFQSPRYYSKEGEKNKTFAPLNELLPQHTTPELLFLETKWAALIPFEKTASLLKEILPIAETMNAETIHHNLQDVATEEESLLGEEAYLFNSGSILDREELDRPERTMAIGMDGGYIRDWDNKKNIFEVIVGKTIPAERAAKCFGFVGIYDTKPKRRLYEHLKSQGMQPHQSLEFFCDGADNLRNLQTYLNAESTQILDWFHITMRLTVLNQYALGFLKNDAERGVEVQRYLERTKWNLWHGDPVDALWRIKHIENCLEMHQDDEATPKKYGKCDAFIAQIADFGKYITNNSGYIVNYGERYRNGEIITTSFVESTVNYVIAKRFVKKQSMQWTKKGTHLLLQVRTKVLNNEWEDVFRRKYPKFRPVPAAA